MIATSTGSINEEAFKFEQSGGTVCCRRGSRRGKKYATFCDTSGGAVCHWTVQCPLLPAQWPQYHLAPFLAQCARLYNFCLLSLDWGCSLLTPGQTCHAFTLMTTQGSGHQWVGRAFEQPLQCSQSALGTVHGPPQTIPMPLPSLWCLAQLAFATNQAVW